MFKRIVLLFLVVCIAGCSGKDSKDKSEKTDQQTSQLRQNVRLVSSTLPAAPQQLENELVQAAPDNCLAFATWSGHRAQSGSNLADKLLANPEFTEPIEKMASCLSTLPFIATGAEQTASSKPVNEFVLLKSLKQSPEMMKMLSSTPGCAFFGMSMGEKGNMPQIDAAIVFQAGDRAEAFYQHLQNGFSPFGNPIETVEVRGLAFSKMTIEFEGQPFELVLGVKDGNFIVGLGAKSVEGVLSRIAAGKNPAWYADSKLATEPWPQQTEYLMVDVGRFIEMAGGVPRELETMNLQELSIIEMLTGRTDQGVQHRLIVQGGQNMVGVGGFKQIDFKKFDHIPSDAQAGMVYSIEPEKVYSDFMRQLERADEYTYQDFTLGERMIQQELGINLRKDVLANLGSNLSFHAALNDGLIGGMVASIDIKDKAALQKVIDKLLTVVRNQIGQDNYYGPKFRLWKVGEHQVGSFIDRYFVVEPCWCITGDRLIVALSPEAMRTALAPPTAKPLFDGEKVKLFERPSGVPSGANEKLAFAGYVDMKTVAQVFYPMMRGGLSAIKSNIDREFGDDLVSQSFSKMLMNMELPPLRTIVNDLGPATFAIRLNEKGIEYEFSHTLPVLNPVGSLATGFACSLPAIVSQQKGSAQTKLNLRMIGLACHNYESAFNQFPTDIVDANGKPLLSWRVKILPFIEQQNLADLIRMDEPWDSEHNKKFLKQIPEVFRSTGVGDGMTTLRGIGGKQGSFLQGLRGVNFGDMTDGSSNTVWTVDASKEFAVEWLKPGALDAETVDVEKLFGNRHRMLAGFGDGSVQRLPRGIGPEKIRHLFTIADGNIVDMHEELHQNKGSGPLAEALLKAVQETSKKIFGPVEMLSRPPRSNRYRSRRVRERFGVREKKFPVAAKVQKAPKRVPRKAVDAGSDSK